MTGFLVDKSALSRATDPGVAGRLRLLSEADAILTCPVIDLEVLYSARSRDDYETIRNERQGFRSIAITPEIADDALVIQRELATAGKHRLPIPDLLIASSARAANATVLHYDADFETIASVVDLDHRWIAERGSL